MRTIEITGEDAEEFDLFINEDLIDDLYRPFYGGLGVVDDDGVPLGALVYELLNTDSEEKDITGVIRLASALNDEVWATIITEYGYVAQEKGVVRSFFETEKEAEAKVFASYDFSFEKKISPLLRISLDEVRDVKLNLQSKLPDYITSISAVSPPILRNGVKNALYNGQKGAVSDLAYLPMEWFEREVSSCCVTDGKVNGLLLIRKQPSGSLFFVLYTCFGPNSRKNLVYMLIRTLNMMFLRYPPETEILVNRRNEEITSLTGYLLPGHGEREVYAGVREEA